jgi:fructose-bisphosphate aldolase class 1
MQETINAKPITVEKEVVPHLKFKKDTIIKQQDGLMERLMEATKLGNIHKGKVVIIFEDDEGIKQVETTIWATGLKYICLKGGIWLPIASIHKIEFI